MPLPPRWTHVKRSSVAKTLLLRKLVLVGSFSVLSIIKLIAYHSQVSILDYERELLANPRQRITKAIESDLLRSSSEGEVRFPLWPIIAPILHREQQDEKSHFDSLTRPFTDRTFERVVASDDDERLSEERDALLAGMDHDLDETHYRFDEKTYPRNCIRPAWSDGSFPNCNLFHEIPLNDVGSAFNITFLGHGHYRDSFSVQRENEIFVLKRLRMQQDFSFVRSEQMRTEALLLEKFSTSPRFTNIYGYCDTSLLVEIATEFTDKVVPFDSMHQLERGRISQSSLDSLEKGHTVHSFNNFTSEQKLDMAIQMAEALAEFHGFDSVIQHNDIHPDNFLITNTGRLVMNDVNNAFIMEWNPIKNEYCLDWYKYMGDEYFMDPRNYNWNRIDESYDILPMGYMIFIMLTGLWPYYDFSESQSREVQKLALKGIRPYINPAYGSRSIIESRLVELMFKCLDPDPAHRPDAFEIVRFLRSTRHLHEQETKAIMTKRHF